MEEEGEEEGESTSSEEDDILRSDSYSVEERLVEDFTGGMLWLYLFPSKYPYIC